MCFRPGSEPLKSLAVAILRFTSEENSPLRLKQYLASLRTDREMLDLTAKSALPQDGSSVRLVVFVDQFEELFTSSEPAEDRKAFVDNLLYAASLPGGLVIVVFSLRSDFYGNCAAYPELASALPKHHQLVGPMTPEQLRQVILRPATYAGCFVEPALVVRLLEDVESEPGTLPLLQYTLAELWRLGRGSRLCLEDYVHLGGIAGVIEQRAEKIYDQLDNHDRNVCKRIFLRLTQPAGDDRYVRCRCPIDSLTPSSEDHEGIRRVEEVISRLSGPEARLITVFATAQDGAHPAYVDVAHEILIQRWKRLRAWLNEDREFLLWKQRLHVAMMDWDRYKKDYRTLLSVPMIEEAQRHKINRASDFGLEEIAFIEASVAAEEQRKRSSAAMKRRRCLERAAVGVLLSALVAGAVWTYRKIGLINLQETATQLAKSNKWLGLTVCFYVNRELDSAESKALLQEMVQAASAPLVVYGKPDVVNDLSLSPNGKYVAVAADLNVRLFDADTGAELRTLQFTAPASAVAFSSDGKKLAGVSSNGDLAIVSVLELNVDQTSFHHEHGITALAFVPDSNMIVIGCERGEVQLLSPEKKDPLRSFGIHSDRVRLVAVSPSGDQVASAGDEGRVRVASVTSATEVSFALDGSPRTLYFFSKVARLLISTSLGRTTIWDTDSGRELSDPSFRAAQRFALFAVSQDGGLAASVDPGNSITVWKLATMSTELNLPDRGWEATKIALDSRGTRLAVANKSSEIRLYELSNPKLEDAALALIAEGSRSKHLDNCSNYLSGGACRDIISRAEERSVDHKP
jgi:hypothetical protein